MWPMRILYFWRTIDGLWNSLWTTLPEIKYPSEPRREPLLVRHEPNRRHFDFHFHQVRDYHIRQWKVDWALTLYVRNPFFGLWNNIFALFIISQHCNGTDSWNTSWWKTEAHLCCIIDTRLYQEGQHIEFEWPRNCRRNDFFNSYFISIHICPRGQWVNPQYPNC